VGDSIALHNGVGRIKESKQAVNRIECTTIMKKIVADRKMPQESEEDVSSFHIRPLALLWIGCTALIFQVLVGWFYYKDASNPTIGTCVPPIVPVLHYIHIHSSRCQMSFFFFQEGVSLNRILSLIMTAPPSHVILGVRIIGNWS